MKNTRFYTNSSRAIRWDSEKCQHEAKCLGCVPFVTDKPGIYSVPISESEFESILSKARFCPSNALVLVDK
ncbi:MAG: (4Fe-4S)-binding protein [Bacteroidales bacterium]|nr:(4Fe-4S)-binding protein [Bacteroidales bacterium]